MSDKPFEKLDIIDKMLRRAYPIGMRDGVDITIKKIIGFELFNTRPYHNYETWSDGYLAEDDKYIVRREDLYDCIKRIHDLRTQQGEQAHIWELKTDEDKQAHKDWVKSAPPGEKRLL